MMTTMAIIEIPKFDKEYLGSLERKIENNRAVDNDYKLLDDYIHTVTGLQDYILNELKRNNLYSYSDYISERNKGTNVHLEGAILGMILGVISALKRHIENNIF